MTRLVGCAARGPAPCRPAHLVVVVVVVVAVTATRPTALVLLVRVHRLGYECLGSSCCPAACCSVGRCSCLLQQLQVLSALLCVGGGASNSSFSPAWAHAHSLPHAEQPPSARTGEVDALAKVLPLLGLQLGAQVTLRHLVWRRLARLPVHTMRVRVQGRERFGCAPASSPVLERAWPNATPRTAHLYFMRSCDGRFLAEVMRLATYHRAPPCSSWPLAGAHVGRCAVVMLLSLCSEQVLSGAQRTRAWPRLARACSSIIRAPHGPHAPRFPSSARADQHTPPRRAPGPPQRWPRRGEARRASSTSARSIGGARRHHTGSCCAQSAIADARLLLTAGSRRRRRMCAAQTSRAPRRWRTRCARAWGRAAWTRW